MTWYSSAQASNTIHTIIHQHTSNHHRLFYGFDCANTICPNYPFILSMVLRFKQVCSSFKFGHTPNRTKTTIALKPKPYYTPFEHKCKKLFIHLRINLFCRCLQNYTITTILINKIFSIKDNFV